jgi:predicted MPP superfamily phosphohydrolase
LKEDLSQLCQGRNGFTILLSHRPELFDAYADYPINLVLTGHAHGGQFRLPFVGGVVAPHQGFFPKYDKGIYRREGTNMVVSCGLGNSAFPVRFNNPSELVVVELNKEW